MGKDSEGKLHRITSHFLCQIFMYLACRITGMMMCCSLFQNQGFQLLAFFFFPHAKLSLTLVGLEIIKNYLAERLAYKCSITHEDIELTELSLPLRLLTLLKVPQQKCLLLFQRILRRNLLGLSIGQRLRWTPC